MQGPPDKVVTFAVVYTDGHEKRVPVYDWNRGGAWGTICRDLNKSDHGDTNLVEAVRVVKEEKKDWP